VDNPSEASSRVAYMRTFRAYMRLSNLDFLAEISRFLGFGSAQIY
jgi:hypothetical protein